MSINASANASSGSTGQEESSLSVRPPVVKSLPSRGIYSRSFTRYWITNVSTVVRATAVSGFWGCQNARIKVLAAAPRTPALTLALGAPQLFVAVDAVDEGDAVDASDAGGNVSADADIFLSSFFNADTNFRAGRARQLSSGY